MKKYHFQLILCLLFITACAMCCEDNYPTKYIDCQVTEVELHHKDNSGQYPETPKENKVKKEAYLLEIDFRTEEIEEQESYYNQMYYDYQLKDGIVKINVFTEEPFNDKFPKGSDVSSCFKNYPSRTYSGSSPNRITDITVNGDTIYYIDKKNYIWKALMTSPNPGLHRFKVILTTASGATFEQITEPINLY